MREQLDHDIGITGIERRKTGRQEMAGEGIAACDADKTRQPCVVIAEVVSVKLVEFAV